MGFLQFITLGRKKQEKTERDVTTSIDATKQNFNQEMQKVRVQSKKVRQHSHDVQQETEKLFDTIDSIAGRIAIATGGGRRGL